MIKGIINKVQALMLKRSNLNKVYLNDPITPNLIVEIPELKETYLPMRAIGDYGGGYPLGSIQQQALATKQIVNEILTYLAGKSPKKITDWNAAKYLTLIPRAGKDINAYYDRSSLKFFYFPVDENNIYTCNCKTIVSHEFGHAFLDILRPDLWNVQSFEVWAFHEAFGDIIALISLLQNEIIIEKALEETDGNLFKSNILTRLAPEMGMGFYKLTGGKDGELPNAMRDLSIKYKYIEPEKLSKKGSFNILTKEPHSFSRILSGTFYEIFIKIYEKEKINHSEIEAIKIARDSLTEYFLIATVNFPICLRVFQAFAKQLTNINCEYKDIIQEVLNSRFLIKQEVKILESIEKEEFIKNIKIPYEIKENNVIRTLSTKNLKLNKHLGITALNDNPLLNLEITIPHQSDYHFNENNQLIESYEQNQEEIINSAYECLSFLHENELVGKHKQALFDKKKNSLVRKQFKCKCNKPNYCDPNAPEFGKPWKPRNNAGCIACHGNCEPQSCECAETTISEPVKTGCFTRIRSGMIKNYRTGRTISRKVC